MTLRVVGVGMGRTGTTSLQLALQRLLDAPCYHMSETFRRPDDVGVWHRAVRGDLPIWSEVFAGYRATVDEPGTLFWRELLDAYPGSIALLSTRPSADWYRSMDQTVLELARRPMPPGMAEWAAMYLDMLDYQYPDGWDDADAAIAVFERHNAEVRATVPAERLVEWQPGDGWQPLCSALGLPVPDEPFPHANSTAEFRTGLGYD